MLPWFASRRRLDPTRAQFLRGRALFIDEDDEDEEDEEDEEDDEEEEDEEDNAGELDDEDDEDEEDENEGIAWWCEVAEGGFAAPSRGRFR